MGLMSSRGWLRGLARRARLRRAGWPAILQGIAPRCRISALGHRWRLPSFLLELAAALGLPGLWCGPLDSRLRCLGLLRPFRRDWRASVLAVLICRRLRLRLGLRLGQHHTNAARSCRSFGPPRTRGERQRSSNDGPGKEYPYLHQFHGLTSAN